MNEIVKEARTWIGTPFLHQGRVKGESGGVDCVGLVIEVYKAVNLLDGDYDSGAYQMVTDGKQLQHELSEHGKLVWNEGDKFWKAKALPGDIALFQTAKLRQHVGIISTVHIRDNTFEFGIIHAYNTKGKVVEHSLNGRWEKLMVQIWRLKNG